MTSITETIATLNELTSAINNGRKHTEVEVKSILDNFNFVMERFNENAKINADVFRADMLELYTAISNSFNEQIEADRLIVGAEYASQQEEVK